MNAADSPVQTAAGRGLLACHHCGTVWRGAQVHEPCARCGTRLHRRKPDSLNRTWALVIAAAILYLPANLLPVMITRTIFGAQYDTIMSGIIYFWVSGAWGLAAIIFIASFLVPLFKLAALAIMVASLALFEGCAPVPLPRYAAYKPRRVEQLLTESENLRQGGDDWERFWFLDQPSHMTPFRTHGGLGP